MTDPLSRADLALKPADEFFDLARKAPTPFMRVSASLCGTSHRRAN